MGIFEVLTIVFIVMKLMGTIDWVWWLVLLPEIIAIGLYIVWFVVYMAVTSIGMKKAKKIFEKDDWFNDPM